MNIKNLFAHYKQDLPAGLVVFLVALPLCLGIALASGAPLFSGIIAGIVGGIIIGSLSGSSVSVSGPAAGLTVIVLSAIETLGSFPVFLLAVMLAGGLQLLMGIFKLGIISHYIPSSVIKGLLAAIGLTLIVGQIPVAFGFNSEAAAEFAASAAPATESAFSSFLSSFNFIQTGAIIISVVSLIILLAWEQPKLKQFAFFRTVPGALFVVVLGILLNQLFKFIAPSLYLDGSQLVQLPVLENLGEVSSLIALPDFTAWNNPQVYVVAFTIAIIASVETLLNMEAADKLDPHKRVSPTNRELKAQGIGNLISGLIGGLPTTSVIVRSSTNVYFGARTKLSTIFHGTLLLVCVLLIPTTLNMLPLSALAVILIVIGYKLTKVGIYRAMYRLGWAQFIPFVATVVAIMLTDLLQGILIGMAVAIFFILWNNYKFSFNYEHKEDASNQQILIELSEEVTFLNKGSMLLTLRDIPENSDVLIDGSRSKNIDYDVLEIINNFKATAKEKNIRLKLKNI
jgi:MFS superfamily sulfate permease-like transporter